MSRKMVTVSMTTIEIRSARYGTGIIMHNHPDEFCIRHMFAALFALWFPPYIQLL